MPTFVAFFIQTDLCMKHCFLFAALLSALASSATPAPDFTVTTSDGQVRKLYQDYVNQGKVVVIEAFFTTCPPCATHAPFFQSLYQSAKAAHPGKVEFLLLSTLQSDNNSKVAAYLTSKSMTMLGAGNDGGSIAALQPYMNNQFGLFYGTPTFIVIAPGTGNVVFDVRGNTGAQSTMTLLQQKIDELLPAPPPTPTNCFLKSYSNNPLENVTLRVQSGNFDTSFIASGTYSLSNVQKLKTTSYSVTPDKKSNPLEGLSTYDLVLINKHILGIDTFAQAWKSVAADMNCSGTVTTYDIVLGRRLILGIDSALACGSWKFVADPPGSTANGGCFNFRGIRLGDLNGQYLTGENEDRSPFLFSLPNCHLQAGETRRLALTSSEAVSLTGLQCSFGFDPAALRIEQLVSSALPDFNEACMNTPLLSKGQLAMVWVGGAGTPLAAGEPLLTFSVTALRSGDLAQMIYLQTDQMTPECVFADGSTRRPELSWDKISAAPARIRLAPNPASGVCYAYFEAEQGGDVLIQIMDVQGRLVFEKTMAVQKGTNQLELRPAVTGLCFVRVDGKAVGKVVLND